MGTAIGPVFDYLNANLPAALLAVNANVGFNDGWAGEIVDDMFFMGRTDPNQGEAEAGAMAYLELGAQRVTEEFDIPFFIDSWRGGSDQSESRNAALLLFDAFVAFLRTDLTLGGALHAGRYAQISSTTMVQTPDAESAKNGRRCLIFFRVTCKNIY